MLIVVLGGGIDIKGILPHHVFSRLDKALELAHKYPNAKIVLCGRYSFLYGPKKPLTTEAEAMRTYLLGKKIPKNRILIEKKSKDTIGNAYYSKKNIFLPRHEKQAIIITSEFHLPRSKYIFQKIFGPTYKLQFVGAPEKLSSAVRQKVITHQKEVFETIKHLLEPMKDGNHDYFKYKIYNLKYYRQKRPDWVIKFVATGK